MKARDLCQHRKLGYIDRDLPEAVEQPGGPPFEQPPLHEGGDGHAARVQRTLDDQGALDDKDGVQGIRAVQKLVFGQARVEIQRGIGKIGDLDDVGHGGLLRMEYWNYSASGAFFQRRL